MVPPTENSELAISSRDQMLPVRMRWYKNPQKVAVIGFILGVIGIAWAPILFRLSEVGPTASAFWRVALAVPVIAVWVLLTGHSTTRNPVIPGWQGSIGLIAAGLFFAGDLFFWHLSLTLTSVANATLFANAAPIFVTLIAWGLFGARFSRQFLIGLLLAVAGAACLMADSIGISPSNLSGDLMGLVTALFLAGYLLTVERLRTQYSTSTIMLWNAVAGAAALLPATLLLEPDFFPATMTGWGVLLALAVVSHTIGQGLIAFAMSELPAPFTAVALLLQPVLAAVFAWVALGESLGLMQALGGTIILTGILLARRGIA
jgi:drug/metabolite transporter (DMT)-like permease